VTAQVGRATASADLSHALAAVAAAARLLVVCDFDGTIAPIVDDPSAATPDPRAVAHLLALADLPGTSVALLSGRSLASLAALSGFGDAGTAVRLVGSHGAEHAESASHPSAAVLELIDRTRAVTAPFDGVELEPKPHGVAVHVRRAAQPNAALAAVTAFAESTDLHVLHGKLVIELSLVRVDKGDAFRVLLADSLADRAVVLGDDVTDESTFAAARPVDVTIKVGDGDTQARHRVHDVAGAVEALRQLSDARASWASSVR